MTITEHVTSMMESRIRRSPCHTNRASRMGHPCERNLVYARTRWQEAKLYPVSRQFIFSFGNEIEEITIRRLSEAGVPIMRRQSDYHEKRGNISGSIDGFVVIDGKQFPIEIKSMMSHEWERISTIDDMKSSTRSWVRGYPAQLLIYMYLTNSEMGLFYLVNKATSEGKEVWIKLDYEYLDSILKRAESVEAHVQKGTVPERVPYEPSLCDSCEYEHICLPPVGERDNLLLANAPQIEKLLISREELSPKAKDYDVTDKAVKDWAKAITQEIISVGDYLIQKKKTAKGMTVKIKNIKKETEDD